MTDEQILEVVDDVFGHGHYEVSNPDWIRFAHALLAAQYQFFGVWGPTGESLYIKTGGSTKERQTATPPELWAPYGEPK